jgi:hypothetical protein
MDMTELGNFMQTISETLPWPSFMIMWPSVWRLTQTMPPRNAYLCNKERLMSYATRTVPRACSVATMRR